MRSTLVAAATKCSLKPHAFSEIGHTTKRSAASSCTDPNSVSTIASDATRTNLHVIHRRSLVTPCSTCSRSRHAAARTTRDRESSSCCCQWSAGAYPQKVADSSCISVNAPGPPRVACISKSLKDAWTSLHPTCVALPVSPCTKAIFASARAATRAGMCAKHSRYPAAIVTNSRDHSAFSNCTCTKGMARTMFGARVSSPSSSLRDALG
jgi:hypothetical protein